MIRRLSTIADITDSRTYQSSLFFPSEPLSWKHGWSQGNCTHFFFFFCCIFLIYRVPLIKHGVTSWSVPASEFSAFCFKHELLYLKWVIVITLINYFLDQYVFCIFQRLSILDPYNVHRILEFCVHVTEANDSYATTKQDRVKKKNF